jgi:N utilization substance protein B
MYSQRRLARITAMQSLFIFLQRKNQDIKKIFDYIKKELAFKLKDEDFSYELLSGSVDNLSEIKDKIKDFSTENSLDKIDDITLSIICIASYELLFCKQKQPVAVIINEAIEIAKEYGKDSSAPFVNGILSKIAY